MNKYVKTALIVIGAIITMLSLMFGTYRFVMTHQQLERGDNGTIYSTMFGMTDTYYVDGYDEDPTTRIMDELYDAFNEVNKDGEYEITRVGNTISIAK